MSRTRDIRVTINGAPYESSAAPNETLLEFLRYRLGLVGTKRGCDGGDCGSCTVILNGKAVNSCMVMALEAEGAEIVTIEGLSSGGALHPLQQAFIDHGAVQCGFCLPGMIVSAKALLDEEPNPTEEEIRWAISGNLCRCADFPAIIRAVVSAGKALRARK